MSLINQMLRDLEDRRKSGTRQPARHQVPSPLVSGRAGSRWVLRLVVGVALGGLVWLGLEMPPQSTGLPGDSAQQLETVDAESQEDKDRAVTAITPGPAPVVAGRVSEPEEKVLQVEVAAVAKPATVGAVRALPENQRQASNPVADPGKIDLRSTGGAGDVELLSLGVVEGIDSIRLMFEFEQLPAYRIRTTDQDASTLMITFAGTGRSSRLEVPPFRGPLLLQMALDESQPDLQLSLQLGKPIRVEAYSLPADASYGDRLLLELSVDRKQQAKLSSRTQKTMGDQLRSQKAPAGRNNVSASEQSEALYRKALRYLEQGNEGAARSQLARALELTPGNVEYRLRLVTLLTEPRQAEKIVELLMAGLTLAPENPQLRTHYGRLLLEQGQVDEALNLLLSQPVPELASQPDYHALLAALEQEKGQFANAATRYRELLQVRPQQADWWLMLGLAYEQLNDGKLSVSAYRQALERDGLSTEHRQFALKRLERLQRMQGE